MPKNNKKRGAQKKGASAMTSRPPTDDENSTGDNWSTASVLSENSECCDITSGGEEQETVEDTTEQENFEDRLCDCIEGLLVKSGPQRKKYLEGLKQAFCKKYVADFLEKRKETVADSLLKCLKRGKVEEQMLAAECLGLLALQLGGDMGPLYEDVQSVLTSLLADNSAAVLARAECASALAMCCFLTSNPKRIDVDELKSKMSLMEDMFRKSVSRKSDSSEPQSSPQMSQLYTNCLDAWCLLLTRTPDFFIQATANSHMGMLGNMLQSSDTDLRIAAGEAIALLYDLNRCIDEDFGEDCIETDSLCEQLKDLSTESTKHISKNALRQQRAKFRDILQTVQDWAVEEVVVKLGKLETLLLEDWSTKVQYNAFCSALRSGINIHLQENVMLRDFFDLGPPLPVGMKPVNKMTKVQRKYYNSQAEKARTVSRAKNRDKRSAVGGF